MKYKEFLIREFERELPNVKKVLERLPEDKFDWKPHEKSMSLGSLAGHIAMLPNFLTPIATKDMFDMSEWSQPAYPTTTAGMVSLFEDMTKSVRDLINAIPDEDFEKEWTFMYKGTTILALPKIDVIQSFFMNHLVHHRAQLSVYLRLLGVPVPGLYGPSADEQ